MENFGGFWSGIGSGMKVPLRGLRANALWSDGKPSRQRQRSGAHKVGAWRQSPECRGIDAKREEAEERASDHHGVCALVSAGNRLFPQIGGEDLARLWAFLDSLMEAVWLQTRRERERERDEER